MQKYNYKNINEINDKGIILKDGYMISFEECRQEWARAKGIETEDSV